MAMIYSGASEKKYVGRTNTKLWFEEGVWDPWFRWCYWHFVSELGFKWLDFPGVRDCLPVCLKTPWELESTSIRIHTNWWFFFLHNYCSPQFPRGDSFCLFMQTFLCCGIVIALWVSPHFFQFDGNLWWCYISIAAHMRSAAAVSGSCNRLKCQYRLLHNIWQRPHCMPA